MDQAAVYDDVVTEVAHELQQRLGAAVDAGIQRDRIILDPGLGFAKTADHNWALLADVSAVIGTTQRAVIGASRKRFLGALLPKDHLPPQRDAVSATLGALLAAQGVWALRVHNVRAHREALDVWQSLSHGIKHA
jgi:dihydropteroate synthase